MGNANDAVTVPPLQVVLIAGGVTTGVGLTVTDTVNAEPVHEPEVGVTEYATTMGLVVEFNNVPVVKLLAFVPATLPVMPATEGVATQV